MAAGPLTRDADQKREENDQMDRSIVCGVDGSVDAQAALGVAADMAARLRLRLIMATVVEPSHAPDPGSASFGGAMSQPRFPTTDDQEAVAKGLLTRLSAATGLERADRRVVTGYPAERLADLADEEEAELIVVGSRGRGAFRAAFLGSVSSNLIGVARCPVLVVPPGASDKSGPIVT
jgi:nucleotide-binding universal stress UspA family protein